jgi:hypothetical protein
MPGRPQDNLLVSFKRGLRELKERDGNPSFRELAKRTDLSHTVLAQAVTGPALPTWRVTAAFVEACGGDVDDWRTRWEIVAEALRPRHEKIAPAGGDGPPEFAADLAAYRQIGPQPPSRR